MRGNQLESDRGGESKAEDERERQRMREEDRG